MFWMSKLPPSLKYQQLMSIFSRNLTSPDPVHSDAVIGPVWVELDLPDDVHDDEDDDVLDDLPDVLLQPVVELVQAHPAGAGGGSRGVGLLPQPCL